MSSSLRSRSRQLPCPSPRAPVSPFDRFPPSRSRTLKVTLALGPISSVTGPYSFPVSSVP